MNMFKLQALKEEFSFLESVVEGKENNEINSIKIKRIDENLLNEKPQESVTVGSLGKSEYYQKFYLINEKQNIIKSDIEPDYYFERVSNTQEESEGESLLEYISKNELQNEVKYIVETEKSYSNWERQSKIDYYNVKVYKPARNQNIQSFIEKAIEKAKIEVMGEISF